MKKPDMSEGYGTDWNLIKGNTMNKVVGRPVFDMTSVIQKLDHRCPQVAGDLVMLARVHRRYCRTDRDNSHRGGELTVGLKSATVALAQEMLKVQPQDEDNSLWQAWCLLADKEL